jgi:1,4-alpha-glucan branching enzyme
MAPIEVHFEYLTGLRRSLLLGARLSGSWDEHGLQADRWSSQPMEAFTADDGCPAFRATVALDDSQLGQEFRWGVAIDTVERRDAWGIPTEVPDPRSHERYRSFTLRAPGQVERYHLTHCRRLGANKQAIDGGSPAIRFAVWAPNALAVELVRGSVEGERAARRAKAFVVQTLRGGYIASGTPAAELPGVAMRRGEDGIWTADVEDDPRLRDFAALEHRPYMYRVTKDDGTVAYRTDLYSRCQIGTGSVDPEAVGADWSGLCGDLDGSKSCSVVVDPDVVCEVFQETDRQGRPLWPETRWVTEQDFWRDEFDPARPLPSRIEDLVIYELHVDGLGLDRGVDAGTLQDAIALIPYVRDLGVNAVELMPMAEFQDRAGWGYSTSHYFAIEYAGGGRDKFKHFVRECHRNGIAVILDVVYNHYSFDAERAEWGYDSNAPERNIYYWYEGRATDYAQPDGGYLDNGSSGQAPRFCDELVRKMFVSSAAGLLSEFHFDGFRVDLTQAIHRDNVRHADGQAVDDANLFGQKLLREWSRTLRLIRPNVYLIAEDHTGWAAVVEDVEDDGLGFDATWYADYYHHLIGDGPDDPGRARLIRLAGYGGDEPLRMDWFADVLAASAWRRVIYHESHDEAGNAEGSARTIAVAVNRAPLVGQTRRFAEARVRFAAGVTLLAPGIPMFFMGEEVGASLDYRYDDFRAGRETREDYFALREGDGANLFRFYADLIRLRLAHPALRSNDVDVVHVHSANRMLAFRRWTAGEEMIAIGSLSNTGYPAGYRFENPRIADGVWHEALNSDAPRYGGAGVANPDPIASSGGAITVAVPANGVLVLRRTA